MKNRQFLREFRATLPKEVFRKTPLRLLWLPVFVVLLGTGAFCFQYNSVGSILLGSVILGYTYACMAFVFHDLRHGSIIENDFAINTISRLLIWPCLVSQNFWDFWHNQLHHKHHLTENRALKEYPTESFLKGTWLQNLIAKISPPEAGVRGFIYLFFWYVPFIVLVQTLLLFQRDRFKSLQRSQVVRDFAISILIWSLWIFLASPQSLLLFLVLPYLIQSFILSAFVVTNHHPSLVGQPEEKILSTCSVTSPWIVEKLTLEFGLHTEHHLVPDVSPAHLPLIRKILKERYPDTYCHLPMGKALWKIYFTKS